MRKRSFEISGPVYPEDNYVVERTEELSDFVNRLERGRYVVLFAPRQTGKTTFFRLALDRLAADMYLPIRLDFQSANNLEPSEFYEGVYEDICEEIEKFFQNQAGKAQLVAYVKLERAVEGYYVVFDHRSAPESRTETETLDDNLTIRSYIIPVLQERPHLQDA